MARKKQKRRNQEHPMLFHAWNYKVLSIGILLVILGFTAMYLDDTLKGFISLYISPVVIMVGYITVIFAIIRHKGTPSNSTPESSASS